MKRWRLLPDSLVGWVLMVLLAGLVLSQLAALVLFAGHRGDLLDRVGARQTADRIVAVVRAVAAAPAAERPLLVESLDVPGLRIVLSPEPLVNEDERRGAGHFLHEHFEEVLKDLGETGGSDIRVRVGPMHPPGFRHPGHPGHQPPPGLRALHVSVPLADGEWLNFSAPLDRGEGTLWRPAFALPFVIMLLAVGAASVWAVRRATRSFAVFADAADRLGRDVTAQPLAEDGPREVRQMALAFNRMQTRLRRFVDDRTHMLAAISHDLRTPITRLRLRAEFIDDGEQRDKMLADLDEMEAMIKATLAFARDDAVRETRELVNVAGLVRHLVADAQAGGAIATYAGPDQLLAEAAPLSLKRALSNLIDNAVRYGDKVAISLASGDGDLVISIDDAGPGIPPIERERVFAPFYRLEGSRNRETGGTGLGLSVARGIIRAHGGDIELQDGPDGGGLRVRVTLPGAAKPAPHG